MFTARYGLGLYIWLRLFYFFKGLISSQLALFAVCTSIFDTAKSLVHHR